MNDLLSLYEVRSLRRPALFLEYGDNLLYDDERLFDLTPESPGEPPEYPPLMLPAQVLERGTGIEFGWRHLAGCDCAHCCSEGAHSPGSARLPGCTPPDAAGTPRRRRGAPGRVPGSPFVVFVGVLARGLLSVRSLGRAHLDLHEAADRADAGDADLACWCWAS